MIFWEIFSEERLNELACLHLDELSDGWMNSQEYLMGPLN